MAAVVLKDHHRSTFMEARLLDSLAQRVWPEAIGGIVLNHSQGGLSAVAVTTATRLGARVVWMPTVSAAHHQRLVDHPAAHPIMRHARTLPEDGRPITVVGGRGRLVREADAVISAVAAAGAVLATGHLSVDESVAVAERGREAGVRVVVATHPTILGAAVADLRALADAGATIEHECSMLLPESTLHAFDVDDLLAWIDAVGVDRTVLGSDLGQMNNPLPAEGLARAWRLLRSQGVAEGVLRSLLIHKPREILEL